MVRGIGENRDVLEIPPLPSATILLVEVGSTADGTGLAGGEDQDELGVVVESPASVLGLNEAGFRTVMQRTQPEGSRSGPGDTDRTLYSLRRFLRLAASGNPSIMMSLWAPVLHSTNEGRELRALSSAFVGRHVIPRYRGYMQAQAQRLLGARGRGHGRRGGGGREELVAAYGYDTKYAMHCARAWATRGSSSWLPASWRCRLRVKPRSGYARCVAVRCHLTTGGHAFSTSMHVLLSWNATNPSRRVRTGTASKHGQSTHIFESGPIANRTPSSCGRRRRALSRGVSGTQRDPSPTTRSRSCRSSRSRCDVRPDCRHPAGSASHRCGLAGGASRSVGTAHRCSASRKQTSCARPV